MFIWFTHNPFSPSTVSRVTPQTPSHQQRGYSVFSPQAPPSQVRLHRLNRLNRFLGAFIFSVCIYDRLSKPLKKSRFCTALIIQSNYSVYILTPSPHPISPPHISPPFLHRSDRRRCCFPICPSNHPYNHPIRHTV